MKKQREQSSCWDVLEVLLPWVLRLQAASSQPRVLNFLALAIYTTAPSCPPVNESGSDQLQVCFYFLIKNTMAWNS